MLPLLRLLQDGRFHSGEALGAVLGVSRSAIWKQLQVLEAELGLPVHKVRGRGYRLESPFLLLDEQALVNSEYCHSWPVSILQSVDSTNAEVFRRLARGHIPPFIVLAERQVAGRGRRGRNWVSPFGENLYYSLAIQINGGMRQLEGLSLTVGLALLRALQASGMVGAGLKWPNDVLVSGSKIAGILLELTGDPADVCHVVIGIGVNVNMLANKATIDQSWTSMRAELGHVVDRNIFIRELNRQLSQYLGVHQEQGFSALRDEWQDSHLWQGLEVTLTAGTEPVKGVVLGVDQVGAIRLCVAGVEESYSGGELGLRLHDDS
ncbi:bifunctional biotin--[acetyl-CoA-carboxylase] ligase/biotin operon repressor BirA [Pseudomonas sp.]|uniref:bifunctional biotin--[acetyl-CoA-carboxylase] ligase/biotin operon repressor BirA n=1 Tax=Pseudomonas sp. TaxID=306 RepID=UPI00272F62E5|nr:bifunctional biotin--[acetyl-CoA-carboxylase] ligase/biotin operon repressor BirA [Pseudomonas sp.]MDP2245971.1 bifunctional biotin--[acetyl-CoA-carboxylase] ligase/biotin operon repressor BirA [Pseudomonas sp.]